MFRGRRLAICLFTLLVLPSIIAVPGHADGWGFWGPYIGLYGPRFGGSPYSLGQIPTPPYFALHPPVYYSVPVPRTYGYSPFAYPGCVMTPEVIPAAEPAVIENPYYEGPSVPAPDATPTAASTDDGVAVQPPQWIQNPFVAPASSQWANYRP